MTQFDVPITFTGKISIQAESPDEAVEKFQEIMSTLKKMAHDNDITNIAIKPSGTDLQLQFETEPPSPFKGAAIDKEQK